MCPCCISTVDCLPPSQYYQMNTLIQYWLRSFITIIVDMNLFSLLIHFMHYTCGVVLYKLFLLFVILLQDLVDVMCHYIFDKNLIGSHWTISCVLIA